MDFHSASSLKLVGWMGGSVCVCVCVCVIIIFSAKGTIKNRNIGLHFSDSSYNDFKANVCMFCLTK
jgi:hypothetical protein